MNMKGSKCDLY